MNESSRRIPALVTLDVHDEPEMDRYFDRAVQMLAEMGIPATYFVPAQVFRKYPKRIAGIPMSHQIACHGLFHDGQEVYDLMASEMQREYIRRATEILSDGLGRHPGAFRSPGFRISGTTLCMLQECGYYADVSVNSGRLEVTSTRKKETRWFLAPRVPYHPDPRDPFRRGNLSLWEIPVSAFVLPFTSNAAVVLGACLTKLFAALLYQECRVRHKPMVYMSHPEDLCENGPERKRSRFNLKLLLPRDGGFPIRHYLSCKNAKEFYRINRAVLEHLQQLAYLEFLTVEAYVRQHLSPSVVKS